MAFFDELSKKLTDAGKVVVRKTRELTDVSGLKLKIADENRKMTRLYENLGKEYFALHQEQPEEELKGLVQQLKTSMERVSALETEIEKVEAESRAQAEEERRKRAEEAKAREEKEKEEPVADAEFQEVKEASEGEQAEEMMPEADGEAEFSPPSRDLARDMICSMAWGLDKIPSSFSSHSAIGFPSCLWLLVEMLFHLLHEFGPFRVPHQLANGGDQGSGIPLSGMVGRLFQVAAGALLQHGE